MADESHKIKIKIKGPDELARESTGLVPDESSEIQNTLTRLKYEEAVAKAERNKPLVAEKKSLLKKVKFFGKKKSKTKEVPKAVEAGTAGGKNSISKKDKKDPGTPSTLFAGFSIKELTHFAKRLAFLIKSGIPILESLELLRKQTRSKARGRILDVVIADVSNGRFLSAGLARFRKIFGDFTINLVRVGEMSGTLSQNLTYLSIELEKRNALKRKVISALVYPAFITVATIGITVLLTVYIFPKVMPIFTSLNVKLPFTTLALLFLSNFLRSYGIYTLIALIIAFAAYFFALRRSEKMNYFVSRNILRLPLFGRLVINYNMTNFCRTLSLLLRSGFNVVEAVTVTGDSTPNVVYKKECLELRECIIKGERLSQHLEKHPKIFPDMVSHMITIGERSGTLADSLMYLAEHYEAEVDDTIKNLSSTIEPVLMVFMGLLVGFVAVSIITPIYAVTQHLNPQVH